MNSIDTIENGPAPVGNVPFAEPTEAARFWPVRSSHPQGRTISFLDREGIHYGSRSRAFLAARQGGRRYHVGVDLYGNPGDMVVAPEDGQFVNTYHFYGGTNAFFFQTKSGLVLNLAEVRPNSWEEFGVALDDEVPAGHPLARVGRIRRTGSSMLHFEAYRTGTRANQRWAPGQPLPDALLNPTRYLIHLAQMDVSEDPDPVLERSDYGPAVTRIQEMLGVLGYQLAPDGDFGPKTEEAVIAFQTDAGLSPDGIVGPVTWSALRAAVPDC